jgi:hypothetical protein
MANSNASQTSAESTHELYEQTQRVKEDIARFSGAARQTVTGWEEVLREQLTRHPYGVLAAAAGVGYVLGGGVPSLVVRALLGVAGRVALQNALMSLTAGSRLTP